MKDIAEVQVWRGAEVIVVMLCEAGSIISEGAADTTEELSEWSSSP